MQEQQTTPSARELVGELADLAAGAGMLLFTLAPFALPALVLIAVVAAAGAIPVLAGALLAAPFLRVRWTNWISARSAR